MKKACLFLCILILLLSWGLLGCSVQKDDPTVSDSSKEETDMSEMYLYNFKETVKLSQNVFTGTLLEIEENKSESGAWVFSVKIKINEVLKGGLKCNEKVRKSLSDRYRDLLKTGEEYLFLIDNGNLNGIWLDVMEIKENGDIIPFLPITPNMDKRDELTEYQRRDYAKIDSIKASCPKNMIEVRTHIRGIPSASNS